MTTITKKLRDAAMVCTKPYYATALRGIADDIQAAILDLNRVPDADNMQHLNGLWACGERLLDNVPAEADPQPPVSGAGVVDSEPMRKAA